MASDLVARQPDAVLFCCNFNQVRSPMAEALMKYFAGTRIFVDSCGLKRSRFDPDIDDMEVDPLAAEVMKEIDVDLTRHRCKTFDDLEDDSFDLAVSLTPEAQHRAVELARGRSAEIEYWPTLDPTLVEGSREHRLEAYRQVRDALAARIRGRFAPGPPIDL
jgi:protein-tyrosine-phosphatase